MSGVRWAPRGRFPAPGVFTFGAGLAVAAVMGALSDALSPSTEAILVGSTLVVLALPLAHRFATHSYDVLEPLVPVTLALALMFVVRPAELLRYDVFRDTHNLYDISGTFEQAQLVALAGCVGLLAGYASPLGAHLGRRVRPLSDNLNERTATAICGVFIALGFVGYGLYSIQAGLSPLAIFSDNLAFDAAKSTAYLYNAPYVCIPAALVLMRIGVSRGQRTAAALGVVLVSFFIYALAPSGQRLWLLLLVMSLVVYPMLHAGWRPRGWLLALILVPALVLVISMRDLNAPGNHHLTNEIAKTVTNPDRSWREFITGPDTEMFSMLALELRVVPHSLPFHPGNVAVSLLTQPVPRALYPGPKPRSADTLLNDAVYPKSSHKVNQPGAAPSILGVFYLEGGVLPVIFGMALLGLIMRAIWTHLRANATNEMVFVLYASLLPLTIVVLRGNPSDTLARSLFTIGPIFVVSWLARRPRAG